jgi:hypothetical protein
VNEGLGQEMASKRRRKTTLSVEARKEQEGWTVHKLGPRQAVIPNPPPLGPDEMAPMMAQPGASSVGRRGQTFLTCESGCDMVGAGAG